LEHFPRNSSWEIASTLPALIPASPSNPTPIHIHVHHEAIRVAYQNVVKLVPKLLPPGNPLYPQPDIILHIGLAAGRDFFALEQGAHGRGFSTTADVDGELFPDADAEKRFPSSKYPTALTTSFDTADVLARWKAKLGCTPVEGDAEGKTRPDVRISHDAGNFLCGFIYYNSLAHYFSIKDDYRPVAFMHVPDLSNDKNGAVGVVDAHNEAQGASQSGQVDDTATQGT
jgi:pyroglutamyl-peptidase